MSELQLRRRDDGTLVLSRMPPFLAMALRRVPERLGADQPDAVRRRLYPDPSEDEEAAADWRRTQHPELFALLADARQILLADLATLRPTRSERTWSVEIPERHVQAWLTALHAAAVALGAVWNVEAQDMRIGHGYSADPRGAAIFEIDLLAWIQGTLLEYLAPPLGEDAGGGDKPEGP